MPAKRKPAVPELRRRAERLAALSGSWRSEAGWEHHPWQCTKKTLDRSPNFTAPPRHLQRSKNTPFPAAPRSLGCSMISRCFSAHPYTCVHDLPQQKVRQCQTEDHWSRWAFSHQWITPKQAVLCSPTQRRARGPQPKTEVPPLSANSILTKAVRIIVLHLLSQNRAGALPCWSKHSHQSTQGQHDFCWQGLWHKQCLPWCVVRG